MTFSDDQIAKRLAEQLSNLNVGKSSSAGNQPGDRTSILRDRKHRVKRSTTKNIKYVLRKTVSGVTSIYVCGWRPQCQKVLDLPAGASLGGVAIDNDGGDSWQVNLYYRKSNGDYVFQLWDPNFLLNEYIESGLNPFDGMRGVVNTNTYGNAFANGSGGSTAGDFLSNYGTLDFIATGYGRFIANYAIDANTSYVPFPGGTPSSGSVTGAFRMMIDLQQSPVVVEKVFHPVGAANRSLTSSSVLLYQSNWEGLTVFASALNTAASSFKQNQEEIALPKVDNYFESRLVYKVNQSGDVGLGEVAKEKVFDPSGSLRVANENHYLYVNNPSGENLYFIQDVFNTATTTTNRFILETSGLPGSMARFADITPAGFSFIETQQANLTTNPPIPSTSLYQIERSPSIKRVTVQILDFQFERQRSVTVQVHPPDINQGTTSNFGTILAASYG